jgi:hypothetical protein
MAAYGIPEADIARVLGVSKPTLWLARVSMIWQESMPRRSKPGNPLLLRQGAIAAHRNRDRA